MAQGIKAIVRARLSSIIITDDFFMGVQSLHCIRPPAIFFMYLNWGKLFFFTEFDTDDQV